MKTQRVAVFHDLIPEKPARVTVSDVDLVVVRWKSGPNVSVLYGRSDYQGGHRPVNTVVLWAGEAALRPPEPWVRRAGVRRSWRSMTTVAGTAS
jgi:hypothetical protein